MPFNVSGCVSITNVHKPYLSIILKIRKLRHRGLNALPKVKDLVSGRARSWESEESYQVVGFYYPLYYAAFSATFEYQIFRPPKTFK